MLTESTNSSHPTSRAEPLIRAHSPFGMVEITCSPMLPQHCEYRTSVVLYSSYYHTENSWFAYILPLLMTIVGLGMAISLMSRCTKTRYTKIMKERGRTRPDPQALTSSG